MDEIDKLLGEAGERWRASQPPRATFHAASPWRDTGSGAGRLLVSFAAGAVGAALVLATVGITAHLAIWPRVEVPNMGTASTEATASSPVASDEAGCAITRPNPAFVAPSPYPAAPPPLYESDWFGSEALWTMIDRDGEVWSDLPQGPDGLTQKTFWWSVEWPGMRDEPEPAITVVGTRLDGPGSFTSGPGTNASADFGEAMLVGVEIPTAGCWQITASYGDAVLSYVVWITDD
jgi:hypothetical protein